ncbi:hypothetical protein CGCF415_v002546 [Colletotrichum fructicola]|uniref:Uncharacterized protein n=1 Tax=Colletotrichum fructicola (strain Nara gc5) TaxID=1213859 RepID=A0A7J6J9J0_COLFN|nr:uncharacterized protein CGMCC3_g571 [Colletotrichum fructicola]KAF4486114.1 hypothetical protein CGGC5_v005172 [Colletotrichum fructicola Nara gc5]KAH9237076.1 hypothetical protein K456DRAFT_34186 [Colletotrichum gloeosporioides 23]KAE9583486.1 hypothetical protein CGMCC3_g571 [Colletotrichum fructicola]KAF4433538.1 hypothetical protein CFRS1_v011738 [Colletotrichum fructicola]KAF4886430.1 hypothetical protein CGCFRS4_v011209 [Colletotrichum fructicola]
MRITSLIATLSLLIAAASALPGKELDYCKLTTWHTKCRIQDGEIICGRAPREPQTCHPGYSFIKVMGSDDTCNGQRIGHPCTWTAKCCPKKPEPQPGGVFPSSSNNS